MAAARPPRLYTPELLALATGLAAFPLDDGLRLRAECRSRTCGSTIALGLALTADGTIARIGMQVSACAIGQASAALLARSIAGRSAPEVAAAQEMLARWLERESDALPNWPDLDLIAPARDHPARHEALLLAWNATSKALSSGAPAG